MDSSSGRQLAGDSGRILFFRATDRWIDTSPSLAVVPQRWKLLARFETVGGALEKAGIFLARLGTEDSVAYLGFTGGTRHQVAWIENPPTSSPLAILGLFNDRVDLGGRTPLETTVDNPPAIVVWRRGEKIAAIAFLAGEATIVPALATKQGVKTMADALVPAPTFASLAAATTQQPPVPVRPAPAWDSPAPEAFSIAMAAERDAILTELSLFQRGDGSESIHQARVAARKLMLLAKMAGTTDPAAEALKQLYHEIGEVRNLDITIAWLEREGAAEASVGLVAKSREGLLARLALAEPMSVLREWALEQRSDIDGRAYGTVIDEQRQKVLHGMAAMPDVENFASLHAFRRRLRRYRYLAQFLSDGPTCYVPSKEIAALGEIADYTVITSVLDPTVPEFQRAKEILAKLLPPAYRRARREQHRFREMLKTGTGNPLG